MATSGESEPPRTSLPYDPRESITYWVISTAHALERELNEVLAPLGITFRQAEVLVCLALEGTMSQSEMARRMGIEAPTLAGIVARMERNGWIVRDSCPADRRKKLLRPTPRVEPLWTQILDEARRVRARAARGIDSELLHQLIQGLSAIQVNLDYGRSDAEPAPQPVGRSPAATSAPGDPGLADPERQPLEENGGRRRAANP